MANSYRKWTAIFLQVELLETIQRLEKAVGRP